MDPDVLDHWPPFVPTHLLSLIPPVSQSLIHAQYSLPLLRREPESVSVARTKRPD